MPSQMAGSRPARSSGAATLSRTAIRRPSAVQAGASAAGVGDGPRGVRGRHAVLEQAARLRLGIEDHGAGIAIDERQRRRLPVPRQRAEPDHHRRAARARQHRDMRRRRAGGQRDGAAARPVGGEKGGGRDVVAGDDRTAGDLRGRVRAAQMREHAVADIGQIGGTGAEIFVFRGAIAGDLGVERRAPGVVGGNPRRDGVVGRLRQRVVFQHRDLEFQNVGRLALNRRDQFGDLRRRRLDRRLQRGRLLRGIADRRPARDGAQSAR